MPRSVTLDGPLSDFLLEAQWDTMGKMPQRRKIWKGVHSSLKAGGADGGAEDGKIIRDQQALTIGYVSQFTRKHVGDLSDLQHISIQKNENSCKRMKY